MAKQNNIKKHINHCLGNTKQSWTGEAKELPALGLVPCLSPAEAVPPEELPHLAAASCSSLLPTTACLGSHLHLLPGLAGSHHHNSFNQLQWNIVRPFP